MENANEQINMQLSEFVEEINTLSHSFIKHLCETDKAPKNAQLICQIGKTSKDGVEFKWAKDFNNSIKLHAFYGYINSKSSVMSFSAIFAALECVRTHINANTVFVVGSPEYSIYMIENEPKILLGVTGEIGCGKSTVVDYLTKKYEFIEYMFAKPLKEVAVCLGFEPHQVFGTQEQKLEINEFWGITGRQFLQVFGSEVCRDFVPKALPQMKFNGLTMWARLFEKFYDKHPNINLAVSDVRFADESQTIKNRNGIIIKIVRNVQNSSPSNSVQEHMSETQASLINPNVIIHNDQDLPTLYKKLDRLIEFIRCGVVTSSTVSFNI
jgi:hypothetical protein